MNACKNTLNIMKLLYIVANYN